MSKLPAEPLVLNLEIDPRLLKLAETVFLRHLETQTNAKSLLPTVLDSVAKIAESYLSLKRQETCEGDGCERDPRPFDDRSASLFDAWMDLFEMTLRNSQATDRWDTFRVFLRTQPSATITTDETIEADGETVRSLCVSVDDGKGTPFPVYVVFGIGLASTIAIVQDEDPVSLNDDGSRSLFSTSRDVE